MKPISVGIIGLGAIGSRLAAILVKEFSPEARVDFLCEKKRKQLREIQRRYLPRAEGVDWRTLVDRADFIIESASQEIASAVAERALERNKQILVLSVGGLLRWNGLSKALEDTQGRLWIPSGALAGVDGLLSAAQGHLRSVTLTTVKPWRGLKDAPYLKRKKISASQITEPTVVFEGNALEAIRAFPRNVNVAATLALAGLGPRKTRVRIVATPEGTENRHEVEIEGDFGRIRTEVRNLPSRANPRTSELAILSTVATLKKIFSRVHIGT